jgi:ABC-2 type transport system ATP-binding protein
MAYFYLGGSMPEAAIVAEGLSRSFGNLVAVDHVDLRVDAGQFFGFLGPNGAGKSTTIRMMTGLLAPTAGRINLLGLSLEGNPVEVKRQIGVVPEGLALFDRLTGNEYLNFVGRMYGLDRATAAQRTLELLDFMDLADRTKTLIVDYSHGMKKKLALAAAVIHGPKILFLDEPFEGVDAVAAGTLKTMLHNMTERGSQGSLDELRAGVAAAAHVDGVSPATPGQKLTLEEIFLAVVGHEGVLRKSEDELSWLK